MKNRVDVAIVCEGTYPYVKGGVSSVVHQIISECPDLSFGVIHIGWDLASTSQLQYSLPAQIKWIYPVHLAPHENRDLLKHLGFRISDLWQRVSPSETDEIMRAIQQALSGDFVSSLHLIDQRCATDETIRRLLRVIRSRAFMQRMIDYYQAYDGSFVDFYWLQREFMLLALTIFRHRFPPATVYHSHTNGYAGLLAALAARQNEGRFLLTEHALYLKAVLESIRKNGQSAVEGASEIDLRSETEFNQYRIEIMRGRAWDSWFRTIGRLTYSQAHAITYLYPEIAQEAETYGCPVERSVVIPNGVDLARFQEVRQAQELRQKLRERTDDGHCWRLGFIGRIVAIKGILDLLSAFAQLLAKSPGKFQLDLIGPADEDPEYLRLCQEKVRTLGLDGQVRFCGPQDILQVMKELDVIVLSSHSEALPMVTLEAMASSLPVVATDVGGVRNVLTGQMMDAGVVVPARHPGKLAEALYAVISNLSQYALLRKNGPRRIAKLYHAESVLEKYRDLYFQLGVTRAAVSRVARRKPILLKPNEYPTPALLGPG